MTVLEKIKRCVSLVWDFQEIYGEEDIEDFCHYELSTYPQHDEIMEYFKQIEELEKENAELKAVERMALYSKMSDRLAKAKEIIADIIKFQPYINRDTMFLSVGNNWKEVIYKAEQFLQGVSE